MQWAPSAYGWSGAVGLLPALLRTPVVTTLHEYGGWGWPGRVPPRAWPVLERTGRYDRESVLLGPRSRALLVTNEGHAGVVRERLHREPALVPIGPNVPGPGPDAAQPGTACDPARAGRRGAAAGVLRLRAPGQGRARADRRHGLLRDAGVAVHVEVAGGFASLALPGEEARSFRAEVEQRIAERGVGDRVHLTGWVDGTEVSELLSAADAVVLPFTAGVTTKSGSLLAALEHGAPCWPRWPTCATPPWSTASASSTSPRGVTRASIAAAVRRLLDDPGLAATVARGGQELAGRRGWPTIAAQHRAVYASVLGAGA